VERVQKATQELKDALASNNSEITKAKIQELKNILGEISTEAYKATSAAAAAAAPGTGGQPGQTVDEGAPSANQASETYGGGGSGGSTSTGTHQPPPPPP
jgi:molecular chaperone DnaK